jgi:hypothetical protein
VLQQRRTTGFVIDSSTKSEAKFSFVTTLPTAIFGVDGAGFPSELKSKAWPKLGGLATNINS